MYKCSAENKVGKDERLIYFYVTSEYVGLDFTLRLTTQNNLFPYNSLQCVCSHVDHFGFIRQDFSLHLITMEVNRIYGAQQVTGLS